jgi:hypothetical protein
MALRPHHHVDAPIDFDRSRISAFAVRVDWIQAAPRIANSDDVEVLIRRQFK